MQPGTKHSGGARRGPRACLATLVVLLAAAVPALAAPAAGATGSRAQAPAGTLDAARERAEVAKVERYWTPARMRNARPLDLAVNSQGQVERQVRNVLAEATTSFQRVPTPEVPPFSVNGRIFVRLGGLAGFCSGTAINSPTRQLVLTAGHCVNSGGEGGRRGVWANYLQFVPAFTGGLAPYGAFVARRSAIYAPKQWTQHANPGFDLGAFLTQPNAEGANVADAVGGGAAIVMGATRHQQFQAFGYPGETKHMQYCNSPYIGDDVLSYSFPGPPTLGIRCRWAPGASGGAWLIGDGTQINGITSYLHVENKRNAYGPYFSQATVGNLVRGL
jgi:V8-like Glu-specific endopeptidase